MKTTDSSKHSRRDLIVLGLILSVIVLLFMRKPHKAKGNDTKEEQAVFFPYRTITVPGDSQNLYAYELHKRKIAQDNLSEYCAIIRDVDSTKEDYKAYCRSVIDDVVKSAGTDKLVVYIYDSYPAYELYETKFLQQFRNLDTVELEEVAEHLVATYVGNREDYYSTNHELSFYDNSSRKPKGHETYCPPSGKKLKEE